MTLLDCLHTFCGSCLKNWFTWQASNPSDSSRRSPFTCPACRAHVRDTRHDAKVTTLLDLFLQSNPSKAKPADERDDIAKEYKPGESVLPVINQAAPTSDDEADLRLLAEVREMSLRDTRGRNRNTNTGNSLSRMRHDHSPGDRAREQRLEDARRRRRAERHMNLPPQMRSDRDPSPQSRQVEHQSSLRSILSSTTQEPAIEEEILRQIAEEGLLDGIDLQSLTPRQEDELTERIAEAFRRRQQEQPTPRESRRSGNRRSEVNAERRTESRPSSSSGRTTRPVRRPPPSSSNLLRPTSPTTSSHRRSLSDQGTRRRRTSPTPTGNPSHSTDSLAQPTNRSSNANSRRRASNASLPPPAFTRGPNPAASTRRPGSAGERSGSRRRPTSRNVSDRQPVESPTSIVVSTPTGTQPTTPQIVENSTPTRDTSQTTRSRTQSAPQNTRADPRSQPQPLISRRRRPSISCERCEREGIDYEVHKYCSKCKDGNYSLCLRCFRLGRGCLHWFGFGDAALYFFEKKSQFSNSPASNREPPHFLHSRRYVHPSERMMQSAGQEPSALVGPDSSPQVHIGMFCDMCESFSDECFWKCSDCNDGEWGFCNRCVNRGKCCTHSLLPITRVRNDTSSQNSNLPGNAPLEATPPIGTQPAVPTFTEGYQSLTFSTKCNSCTYPIPPSSTRFHCSECNDGNYDLCINCYLKLGASGKISKDNGRNGWRRCLQGHRMIIVGFQDHEDGQRRVIVKGLVGGHAMTEESDPSSPTSPGNSSNTPMSPISDPDLALQRSKRQDTGRWTWSELSNSTSASNASISHRRRLNRSRHHMVSALGHSDPSSPVSNSSPTKSSLLPRFPPSGGIGLRFVANWSHYPEPEDKDEIMFPRGAEITEAENINDDWLWGYYAGQTGFFPGGHVIPIDEITM